MIGQFIAMPDQFRLDHPAIDMQHEVLFALYNELKISQEDHEMAFDLGDIFLGLNGYVATHFLFEEELMAAFHYTDTAMHHEEHRRLSENVALLHNRFKQAKTLPEQQQIANDVAQFLLNWLAHHIAEVDRKLVRHLNTLPAALS
ncbi:bacteriohemerythrin [Candidatus Magnetaquicoccus inordinatus]|uniref:bacteriohemerythrin n=1 Tax=Candidatus Magnetaquicoccus inordinatus TaxID=2496818 RepID=UPI00102BFF78|nr:bacteriohemerythrin [Candidatus Magnetaquicoccus inordinatus]